VGGYGDAPDDGACLMNCVYLSDEEYNALVRSAVQSRQHAAAAIVRPAS
jgi:hypothetical protein